MNKPTIDAMTWATLTAAIVSACALAAGDDGLPDQPALFVTGVADVPVSVGIAALQPVAPQRPLRPPSRLPYAAPDFEKL